MGKEPMNIEDFEEVTMSRESIFKGQIIDVKCDTVALPGGKGFAKRELVFHNGGVAVLAITAEQKMVLVRQYRKALEKMTYEIPAGKLEVGEQIDPQAAMLRELEEETGMTSNSVQKIAAFYTAPGFSNEILHLYKADHLVAVEHPLPKDEDEVIERYDLTLAEAKEWVASGEIVDAKTIIAIQYWELESNAKTATNR